MQHGPLNLITDVPGIRIGNAHDDTARTGVTVILCDEPAVAACSIPGGGPGTRETDALQPGNLVEKADAVVLAGGSVYGLEAASAVTAALGRQGRGFPTGAALPSPIVPAAILFDLRNGGEVTPERPELYRQLGTDALAACSVDFALGNFGAGYGAVAGQVKGGLGSSSSLDAELGVLGALLAVNPFGAVVDAAGRLYCQDFARAQDGKPEYGPVAPPAARQHDDVLDGSKAQNAFAGGNTTIGVIACSADLTRDEALRVAIMGQDGFARAINPVHTPFDGDALFVLATGRTELSSDPARRNLQITRLGAEAAHTVARAIGRAVWSAQPLAPYPALNQ
jgi:L-aminopeptidase/D-esterase-like protein